MADFKINLDHYFTKGNVEELLIKQDVPYIPEY